MTQIHGSTQDYRANRRASIIPIVLGIIVVVSMLGIIMLQSMQQRRQTRHDYETAMLLDYTALAGVQRAYHKLLVGDWNTRFYLSGAADITGNLDAGRYSVQIEDDPSHPMTAKITSTARLGNRRRVTVAYARFFTKNEVVAENQLVRKILHQSLWQLEYGD